ncbi:hypothetical protein [Mesorhizobium sp. CN2-181]|uniref:hypothetical protein n=1 Tax=Mesorhizobium yinganensis TaxID=3157707 RepID=UPI0032B7BF98
MSPSFRLALVISVILPAALASGCAGRTPDPAPTGNVPQGDISADEKPEPLPPGVKPLTVEQEEMIAQ